MKLYEFLDIHKNYNKLINFLIARKKRLSGRWIFGDVELTTRRLFIEPVPDRSEPLLRIIRKWTKPGSTVISDRWKSCNCLDEEGCKHLTGNHRMNFIDLDSTHTPNIERCWRERRANVPRCGIRKEHYMYIAECLGSMISV
nr:PREDICTED: uncharacterized protein LOC105664331 [Megachile rotundata]